MSIDIQLKPKTPRRGSTWPTIPSATPKTERKSGAWWKRGMAGFGLLGVFVMGTLGLIRAMTPASSSKALTHTITRGDLVVSVTEQGTLESSSNKEIKCTVKGGSTVLWVIETGTEVKPGDVLVRLDKSTIEDNISLQKIAYETALATKTTSESNVAVARISITEYEEGTFRSEMATKQKDLVIAESNLKAAENSRDHTRKMFRRGYVSKLELDSQEDAVKHADLEVQVKRTELEVLEKFTKAKTLQELNSALDVAEATLASDTASLDLEKARLTREEHQLENCVIRADVTGMVIYPSAAEWKEQPDIEEGATVREDQVLLMIPDLSQMQVKVGIHESKVDRLKVGMPARVGIQAGYIAGQVASIASITKPAGWWTGNLVKYDTIIKLDENQPGLKPGMSVAVEIFLARHENVVTIPVAAVVEQEKEFLCWVETDAGVVQRSLKLGDSNDQFVVVEEGLEEGEHVVLNPLDFMAESQRHALKPVDKQESKDVRALEHDPGSQAPDGGDAKLPRDDAQSSGRKQAPVMTGAAIIEAADKNGDGALTIDEVGEKSQSEFGTNDANGDGKLDVAEMDAAIERGTQGDKD